MALENQTIEPVPASALPSDVSPTGQESGKPGDSTVIAEPTPIDRSNPLTDAMGISTATAVDSALDDVDEQLATLKAALADQLKDRSESTLPQSFAEAPPQSHAGAVLFDTAASLAKDGNPPGATTENAPAIAADAPVEKANGRASRWMRTLLAIATAPLQSIILLDAAFFFVPPAVKGILGYVAVATLILAAGVWFAGSRLQ